MKRLLQIALLCAVPVWPAIAAESSEIDALRKEIELLREDYETRIRELEQRLETVTSESTADVIELPVAAEDRPRTVQQNTFNPAVSVVLQGSVNGFTEDPDEYALPGFQVGGEAGLASEGLALDEVELILSASVDQVFSGQATIAAHEDDGETEVDIEEAYIDVLSMPAGSGLRLGRFYSDVGYLNRFHTHAWDFRDAPLVYRAMLGKQYRDDGFQLSWVAPTDTYFRLGTEVMRGGSFPGGESSNTHGNIQTLFAKTGGDVGDSHSWQAGLSHLWIDAYERAAGGHSHGGNDDGEAFTGDTRLAIADFVWKWAPGGNARERNFKLQGEFFWRDEDGLNEFTEGGSTATLSYDGEQKGLYLQSVYQFMPRWRAGLRYDWLGADNNYSILNAGGLVPAEVLDETALNDMGHDPERWSLMADWSPSEFSRLRLQYNRDESRPVTDHQWTLQYIMSLGAHPAHQF